MTDEHVDAVTPATARRSAPTWLVATISGLIGLFYAYAVWNAIGNLVLTLADFGRLGVSLNLLGWFVWIFAALFPLLVWAAAFALGYRRPAHELLLIMLTGLALVAVFWLNVIAYTVGYSTSLVG
ncbi:bacitracin resistance protein [Microbacterium sp. NEAU-LLC]|uniref:Bacitracin resistance protein n=1 Tax=Microbacterium helvum TaxID=2773713 RepID=A0ABR8NLR5_9MICO|nr:bacitracin resistance protein [Microbacterium helvum]MBD3941613.1 bacitracin resistance protein [Microbacterium helvum]